MATIFEIVEKLRAGQEVIVPSKYAFTVMDQIQVHGDKIGTLPPISFVTKNKKAYLNITK
jgi:hypothetical protein